MKKLAMTGGGTAGHVNPNIAIIPALQRRGYDIVYIGGKSGIERELIEKTKIKYYPISTGKLRRYFDMKNITDMAGTLKGVKEARAALKKEKADIVFSKGGYVGVPVVLAAAMLRIPVIVHESDYSPGLANKIAMPFAKKVCVAFPETIAQIGKKAVLTGNPVREILFSGNRYDGLNICGFNGSKPVLLIIGGSLGSKKINECVRNILPALLERYDVAHICGRGNVLEEYADTGGYKQFDYIEGELPHVLAAADAVVSRAGAGAVSELLALKKPNLLIPLSKNASRGDQILNARSFQRQGYSTVLEEEELNGAALLAQISSLFENRPSFIRVMSEALARDSVTEIVSVIDSVLSDASR